MKENLVYEEGKYYVVHQITMGYASHYNVYQKNKWWFDKLITLAQLTHSDAVKIVKQKIAYDLEYANFDKTK
ncbi:hypothetical protein GD1_99 [Paraglaciecola Antarctic GD virus 1]|nr:hypothetical protein GD1_99 [Paraglaciecola Antarctic GD virus 1]